MRKKQNNKRKLLILLLLFAFGVGLGYAALRDQLTINNTVNYGAMTWDVGYTTPVDGGGTVTTTSSVSADKKTITVSCNLGTSTSSETCIAKVSIKNGSTFGIELQENPTITFDDTYISSVAVTWTDDSSTLAVDDNISASTEEEIQIKITTKELTEDMLSESSISIPVTITMNWVEER